MNTLLTRIQFGLKRFANFRKKLVLDYKKGGKHDHTNPHAIPLELKQKLLNVPIPTSRPKRVETGKEYDNYKGKASLPTADSPNTVHLPSPRFYLPKR